jgi:hypothetical protein
MADRCWQCGRRLSQSSVANPHEPRGLCGDCIADILLELSLDSTVVNRISLPKEPEELVISLFLS